MDWWIKWCHFVREKVEEVLWICLWFLWMLHEKLMFHRDKSTFGALAVPGTYPCGPCVIRDT